MVNHNQAKEAIAMRKRILAALNAEPMTIPQLCAKLNLSRGQVTRVATALVKRGEAHRTSRVGPLIPGLAPDSAPRPYQPEPETPVTRETTPTGHIVRFGVGFKPGSGQTGGRRISGASTLASIFLG